MRIVHVIDNLDPRHGGPPAIVARIAAAQARSGHEVALAAHPSPGREGDVSTALAAIPGWGDVVLEPVERPRHLAGWLGPSVHRGLRRLVGERDVVHLHGVWEPILVATAAACRRRSVPYLVMPNGMLDPWSLSRHRLKKRLAMALAHRRMLCGAAALHLGNDHERRLIAPLGLNSPGLVVPNGVFFDELDRLLQRGRFRETEPRLEGRSYFLYLGRLHRKKGLDLLAEAYNRYVEAGGSWELVVVGPDGGDGARRDFEGRVAGHALGARVHLTGPLYGNAKYHALADAGALVLPSRQEGFSMAITEALGCGLPVIVTEGCHFPEVADAGAGFVTAFEARAFGDAMIRLASDAPLAARMGRAGRELASRRFTWTRVGERLVEGYRRYGGPALADGEPTQR